MARYLAFNPPNWIRPFTTGARLGGAYGDGDILFNTGDLPFVGEVNTQPGVHTDSTWTSGSNDYNVISYIGYPHSGNYVKNSAGRFYRCDGKGTAAATDEPVHTAGSVTGADGYTWRWLSDYPVRFRRFGQLAGPEFTTVNDPLFNNTQTWNNAGVGFQGIINHITDTASAANSQIETWAVNGANKVGIGKQGGIGVFGATPPTVAPTISGSRDGNAAVASLISALAAAGFVIDGTTA